MRIAFGANRYGDPLRRRVLDLLRQLEHEIIDVLESGHPFVDYPDIAALVAGQVSRGDAERGILIGGTGLGMCIVANKFPGVRAAPCHDEVTAEVSRRHHDLNVLCLSASLLGELPIHRIIETWLRTPFDGGRHARRIEKIVRLERRDADDPPYTAVVALAPAMPVPAG
jgi:ribose 5-phosphate isomerase B